jgi:hypothetical protein
MSYPQRLLAGPLGLALIAGATIAAVAVFGSSQLSAADGTDESAVPTDITRARAVATRFLDSMHRHEYAQACALLSSGYMKANGVPDLDACALRLRIAFMGQDLVFRIVAVERAGAQFRVRALANGAPGIVTLVSEDGAYRVASLTDA